MDGVEYRLRKKSHSIGCTGELRHGSTQFEAVRSILDDRSYAWPKPGYYSGSESSKDTECDSNISVASTTSSAKRLAKKLARKEKKKRLVEEHHETMLAQQRRRRRKWSSNETKTRSGTLMRNITNIWYSMFDEQTYIVVNKQGRIFRFSEAKSLFLFDRDSRLRQAAINLVIRPLFSHFIMLVILANCVCMMLAEPPPWIENYLEYVFTAIYCFEAMLKIVGRGFVLHRFAYLRDPWNWLDFIVIVSAIVTEVLKATVSDNLVGQISVLRAFRVLRALKTMSVVPGLRGIVKALLRSIRALKDAVALTIFCVSVFALIGYQLFHGTLRNKCVLVPGTLERAPEAMYVIDGNWPSQLSNFNGAEPTSPFVDSTTRTAVEGVTNNTLSQSSQNISEQFVALPFTLIALYNTKIRLPNAMPYSSARRLETLSSSLLWNDGDKNLIRSILTVMNTSRADQNPRNRFPTLNNSKSLKNEGCLNLAQECVIAETFDVPAESRSSVLQMATQMSSEVGLDFQSYWNCDLISEKKSLSPSDCADDLGGNFSSCNHMCNVSVRALSAELSCLYSKIGIERGALLSAQNNNSCLLNNTFGNALLVGETAIPRWAAKKSVTLFQLQSSNYRNASKRSSFPHEYFLIFEEYNRDEMTDEMEKVWDCNENSYFMTATDSGLYFYANSSNRPGMEPQYCTIGHESMCPKGYLCREAGMNPDYGYTNFDHFFWAFLTSFRLIAQDAWSRLYFLTLHTIGKTYVIFYIIVMFLGSYYLINLILAVVYMAYEEQQAVVEEEEIEAEEIQAEKREFELEVEELSNRESVRSTKRFNHDSSRHVGLITTSLTSITEAGSIRSRHSSSRSSRYGHRRPCPKVDPQSEMLYRKHTLKHGTGISNDRLDQSGSEDAAPTRRYTSKSRRTRKDSFVSEHSFTTSTSEQGTGCNSQERFCRRPSSCQRSLRMNRIRPNQFKDNGSPSPLEGETDSGNKCATPFDKNINIAVSDGDPPVQSFLCPDKTPKPVSACLKTSKTDVLSVDFARGSRSGSMYSTASENSFKSVLPEKPVLCQECSRKQNNVETSAFQNSPSIILDPSSLRQNTGTKLNDQLFLPIPFDRSSHLSSTSSNSAAFDAREQIVQAQISPSMDNAQNGNMLTIPAPAQDLPSSPKEFPVAVDEEITPCSPLRVPFLLVTSASSERISSTPGRASDTNEANAMQIRDDSDLKVVSNLQANDIGESSSFYLPSRPNSTEIAGPVGDVFANRLSYPEDKRRCASSSAIHLKNPTNSDMYDALEMSSMRTVVFNEDVESYETPLMNGYQEKGVASRRTQTPTSSSNNKSSKSSRKKKPINRILMHNYRFFRRRFADICCKWSCCPSRWAIFQNKVRNVVLDPFMDLFITLCIFFNTFFMTIEYHPMDYSHQKLLEDANLVFTIIFSLEMFLKVVGLGPHTYFGETWNVFDAVIVTLSLLELILKSTPGLSVLRTFRLLRILKLAKSWPTLNKLLRIIGRTLGKLWHLTLVFLLILFIFAVVGMQLLRENYKKTFQDNMPRWNFVDFPHAVMVVFRIQCGEWIENMFTCMNVASSGICIPLFILVLVIGNLVILNLFLALLLNSFSGDALQRTDAEPNSLAEAWRRIVSWCNRAKRSIRLCNVVMHCCAKIKLQLCMGDPTSASFNGSRPESKKAKKKAPPKSPLLLALEAPSTEATMLSDGETAMHTNNNCEQGKDDAKDVALSSCHPIRDASDGAWNDVTPISSQARNGETGSQVHHRGRGKHRIGEGGHGQRKRSNTFHAGSQHTKHKERIALGQHREKKAQETVTCSACQRQCQRPMNSKTGHSRARRRFQEGFVPASAFQNRRSEEEEELEVEKSEGFSSLTTHFQLPASGGCRGDEKSESNSHRASSRQASHHGRSANYGSLGKCDFNQMIAGPRKVETGSTTKYSGEAVMDVPLVRNGSRRASVANASLQSSHLSNVKESRDSKKKNEAEVRFRQYRPSLTSNNSSKNDTNASEASLEHDKANEDEEEENKDTEIPQCFPPYWVNNSKEGRCWKIRVLLYKIATHRYFENTVIFFILLSSIALAFEDIHLQKKPVMKNVLEVLDKFFCIFFALEMLIKWGGFGIRFYFTNAWCLLDFTIVFVSVLDLSLTATGGASGELAVLRVLRTFRALRPLRALSRFQGMKVVVDALVRAIPSIGHVFLVCMIVWLIFSILGVNLFGGRFGRCVLLRGSTGVILPRPDDSLGSNKTFDLSTMCDPNITFPIPDHNLPAIRNKSDCELCSELMNTTLIQWVIPSMNFDNVGHGLLSLMQVATFKGWLEIMANAIDITGIEQQPSYEASFANYAYFCVFIVFGAFFSLNLFIGVIIDNFNQQKLKCAGGEDGVFLTEEQRRYYNAMKRMAAKAPSKPIPRPSSHFANKIYDFVTDRKFEIAVMIMILLNMVVMAVEHYDMSDEMDSVLQDFNLFFICVFVLEAILKLIGLRLYYFTVAWNVFDIIVVVISLIASALSDVIKQYFVQPTLFRIIRLFRVTRILRLIREAKGIRTLLFALMMSLPALFNIGSLLFLVIFIYAILGMSQFAYVQKIAGVNNLLNFETFPNSFLVLFQVSTSEGWNTFIEPILRDKPPFCNRTIPTPTGNGDCGNATVGIGYFVTFVFITFLIVINMYIAIILENFEVATRESSEPLTADDFEQFFEVWQRYDDRLTQFVTFDQLQNFLHQLDFPLRVPFPNRAFIANARMKITPGGKIHCLEVIIALIKKVLGDSPELNNFKAAMLQSFMLKCSSDETPVQEETINTMEFVRRRWAAIVIQKAYRKYKCGLPIGNEVKNESMSDGSLSSECESTPD